jgi:hypothetical protein
MQNTVNQYIKNGKYFNNLHPVTSSPFGNNPANGLVTEILHCFTISCYFAK